MDESQRQHLVMAFNNVLRTSALVGVVDVQRAALAFSALLERTPAGARIPLGPLYDFLLEQRAPETAVREVIVFLKSREARFHVTMELPPQLQNLTDEQIGLIVLSFTQRGASSGTYAGRPTAGEVTRPQTPLQQPLQAAAEPAAPKPADPAAPPKRLLVVLGVALVGLVGSLLYGKMTAPPASKPVEVSDPAGIPCRESFGISDILVCRVPREFLQNTPVEVIKARGEVTRAGAAARGFKQVQVYAIEDGKLVWQF